MIIVSTHARAFASEQYTQHCSICELCMCEQTPNVGVRVYEETALFSASCPSRLGVG